MGCPKNGVFGTLLLFAVAVLLNHEAQASKLLFRSSHAERKMDPEFKVPEGRVTKGGERELFMWTAARPCRWTKAFFGALLPDVDVHVTYDSVESPKKAWEDEGKRRDLRFKDFTCEKNEVFYPDLSLITQLAQAIFEEEKVLGEKEYEKVLGEQCSSYLEEKKRRSSYLEKHHLADPRELVEVPEETRACRYYCILKLYEKGQSSNKKCRFLSGEKSCSVAVGSAGFQHAISGDGDFFGAIDSPGLKPWQFKNEPSMEIIYNKEQWSRWMEWSKAPRAFTVEIEEDYSEGRMISFGPQSNQGSCSEENVAVKYDEVRKVLKDFRLCAAVSRAEKKECGHYGIKEGECRAKGCCWKPLEDGSEEPWCFHMPH